MFFSICFSNPAYPPGVPVVRFHVRQTFTLSSLPFKRVTRESTIITHFPSPVTPKYLQMWLGTWNTPIKQVLIIRVIMTSVLFLTVFLLRALHFLPLVPLPGKGNIPAEWCKPKMMILYKIIKMDIQTRNGNIEGNGRA